MKVIVTGASRGLGKGIATYLGRNGCTVGLIARDESSLGAVLDSIRKENGSGSLAACDLRDSEATQSAIDSLVMEMGGLDGLVNNAGLVIRKSALDISFEEWHAMVDTNLNGLFYATRAALPYLVKQERGHIVNISSISGRLPLPGGSGYAATKYAVTGFSESLFQEVRDYGIKVTTVFPGSVDSESHRHEEGEDASWKVTPEEVGKAIADLLKTSTGNCISRLEIRPLKRPPKS